jgi:hypothetical protein
MVVAGCDSYHGAARLRDLDRYTLEAELIPQALGHGPKRVLELLFPDQTDHVVQDDGFSTRSRAVDTCTR